MALRNISNIHGQQIQDYYYTAKQATIRPTSKPLTNNENTKNYVMINPKSACSSSSTSSSASSIQIRTSSPISTSSSSDLSGPANISPSKFISACHQSRREQAQAQRQLPHYVSIKELAFEKFKKQKLIETDLRDTFNLNNHLNNKQLVDNVKLKSYGKLKLSIYNNLNHLTVHVIEGRSFKLNDSNSTRPIETYVKITMLPDVEHRFRKCQTPITRSKHSVSMSSLTNSANSTGSSAGASNSQSNLHLNQFNYDNKFSFEFDQADYNNRLIISVWGVNCQEQFVDTLIGCFSFKIKHVMAKSTKAISQWYHVLPLKYGIGKHLRCSTSAEKLKINDNKVITNVNKDLIGLQKVSLALERASESEGFGFTITNSCPCMVGKVDLDKSAFRAGLRPGDYISKINGKNVSRATCESVVKMIKSNKHKLEIEVYREVQQTSKTSIDFITNKLLNEQFMSNYGNQDYAPVQAAENYYSDYYEPQSNLPQIQLEQLRMPMKQESKQSLGYNQFGLESVPEEDEEDEFDDDEELQQEGEEEDDDDDEPMNNEEREKCMAYINAQQNLRYVDSSSDQNSMNEECFYEQLNEADVLRKAAAHYYNSSSSLVGRKANIMSLRGSKLNNYEHYQNYNNNNQFI